MPLHPAVKEYLSRPHPPQANSDTGAGMTAAVVERFWANQDQIQKRVEKSSTRHETTDAVPTAGSQE